MAEGKLVLAVDNGSGFIKCGVAGDEQPRVVQPTHGLAEADGRAPLCNGIVSDWDAMETYWDHIWTNGMQVDTERCAVVITAHLFETKDNKERLLQSLFESFAIGAVYCSAPPVFELYAAGGENGVVVGCGTQCTYAVMVHEGLPDPRTMLRSDVAGEALDRWTSRKLEAAAGCSLSADEARRAKETLGRVAPAAAATGAANAAAAPDAANADTPAATQFALPDGKSISVSAKICAELAEPLFQPTLVGEASGGAAQLVRDCIALRDRDGAFEQEGRSSTASWYGHIVVAGGSTCFPGYEARLKQELCLRAPKGANVTLALPPERKHAAWLGASILGSVSAMNQMWITKDEYDEIGPLVVHRKCF